jgi:hypothetical protein
MDSNADRFKGLPAVHLSGVVSQSSLLVTTHRPANLFAPTLVPWTKSASQTSPPHQFQCGEVLVGRAVGHAPLLGDSVIDDVNVTEGDERRGRTK